MNKFSGQDQVQRARKVDRFGTKHKRFEITESIHIEAYAFANKWNRIGADSIPSYGVVHKAFLGIIGMF